MPLPIFLAGFLALQSLGPAVERPDDGHGYRISDREVTLDQALELAALAGGTLLVLESAAEESWVRGTFGVERFWLGLEYPRERWANGAPVEYLHWAEGEPGFGDRETFTVMGWQRDSGAWNDVSGVGDRFRAVIETEKSTATRDARLPAPEPFAGRCALVLVVEGLTLADVEDEPNLGLNGLWKESAHAMAAADPSGDALASWGLVAQGVGQAKTDLVDGGKAPPTNWFPTLIERLEEERPEITTGWILDEPELSRMVASGGKMNLRVAQSGAARMTALEDLLGREAPVCAFVGYTLLRAKPDQRARVLHLVDVEVRFLVERLQQRPQHAAENWLVVLAGTPPLGAATAEASAKPRKKDAPFEVARVPLALRGKDFAPGAWHGTFGLADVVPSVAAHFGVRPGADWALDGRALVARPAELDRNLLVNGDAEAQRTRRSQLGPVPGWTSDATMGLGVYQAKRFERDAPGPATRGANHFQGGKTARAELEQRVDVRALAAEIDAKKLTAELSGWLGGLADGEPTAELELACLAENEKELERFTLGPVGSAERRKELGATKGVPHSGLVARTLSAELPKGTRTLRVRLRMQGQKSCERGAADELALVLHAR